MDVDYESWQCQRCGEPIGYLGHFLRGLLGRRLYGRLIGCRYCALAPTAPDDRES